MGGGAMPLSTGAAGATLSTPGRVAEVGSNFARAVGEEQAKGVGLAQAMHILHPAVVGDPGNEFVAVAAGAAGEHVVLLAAVAPLEFAWLRMLHLDRHGDNFGSSLLLGMRRPWLTILFVCR